MYKWKHLEKFTDISNLADKKI